MNDLEPVPSSCAVLVEQVGPNVRRRDSSQVTVMTARWGAGSTPGREFAPAVPTTRAGDVAVPAHTNVAEVRLHASIHNHFPTERHLQNRNTHKITSAAAHANGADFWLPDTRVG